MNIFKIAEVVRYIQDSFNKLQPSVTTYLGSTYVKLIVELKEDFDGDTDTWVEKYILTSTDLEEFDPNISSARFVKEYQID